MLIDSQSVKTQQGWQLSLIRRHKRYVATAVIAAHKYFGLEVEISKRLKPHGWQVLPKRWSVEHTFAWLNHSHRLRKDSATKKDSTMKRTSIDLPVLFYLRGILSRSPSLYGAIVANR